MKPQSLLNTLVNADESVLIVVDVQESFLRKLEPMQSSLLVNRVDWLIHVANKLKIPVIVTAEDIARHGSIAHELADRLLPDTQIYNKMIFNLADQAEIAAAVKNSDRGTCILVGLETDVCIAHSAIGLLEKGYQVCVVQDATCSPGSGHAYGLERLRSAGVAILSVKGLYYEWMRTVNNSLEFKRKFSDEFGSPEGIIM